MDLNEQVTKIRNNMIKQENIWDTIYNEAKNSGCITMEDIIEYLKKQYQTPESILDSEYNDILEGDEDNF